MAPPHVLTLLSLLSLPPSGGTAAPPPRASVEKPPPPVVKPTKGKPRFAQRRLGRPFAGEGTPLVWSATGAVELRHDGQAFELEPGVQMVTAWPGPSVAWLVRSEQVSSGRDLFGSFSVRGDGERAVNGFEALSWLDADGDGAITPLDPAHASLRLWFDTNGDRRAQANELQPLGVMTLPLSYEVQPRCDARGNCARERARAGGGWLIDLHLKLEPR